MAHPKARTSFLHDDHKVQREFERVGQQLANDSQVIEAIASALGSTPEKIARQDPKDIALWALTVFIDGKYLTNKKVVQGINFNGYKAKPSDPDLPLAYVPIEWLGKNDKLDKEFKTIDNAERSNLEAWASIPLADLTAIKGPKSVVVYRQLENLKKYGMKGATELNTIQLVNDEVAPNDNYYYGTNDVGNKGWFPLPNAEVGHAGRLETDFDYSDINAGSKIIGIIPTNKRVIKSSILVNTSFDDNAKISLGDDDANGILATSVDSNLTIDKSYDIELEILYSTSKTLKLYRTAGTPTVGQGTVIVYYM